MMIEPLMVFLFLGILVGIAIAATVHSVARGVQERWERESAHDSDWYASAEDDGVIVMVSPSDAAKLQFIKNHGVETFIDAVKNGDFATIGGEA